MVMMSPDGPQDPGEGMLARAREGMRRRPLMFQRGPAMPGVNTGQPGRPRDYGFMREMFARLRGRRQPQMGSPVPPTGPDGGPTMPTNDRVPGMQMAVDGAGRPPETQTLPPQMLPGWRNIVSSSDKMAPAPPPGPDGGPEAGAIDREDIARQIRGLRPPEEPMY